MSRGFLPFQLVQDSLDTLFPFFYIYPVKHILITSKRGRSLIRKILYYAAMQTIRKNGIMHEYYTRLTSRGMKNMMALIAVSRKLLRIVHAIMRDDREYIVNYESVKRQVIQKAA